jgi:RNA polymerase-binding transcription factor DksA
MNKSFSEEQSRIDTDANALRILGMLKRFQAKSLSDNDDSTRSALDRIIRDGLLWTAKMIELQLSGMTEKTTRDALAVLLKRGLVQKGKNEQWFVTFEGRNAYDDEMHSRLMTCTGEARFRNEALTGVDEQGRRSKLTWAALPCQCEGGRENRVEQETIDQCTRIERVRRACDRYQIPVDAALEKIKTGEIRYCRECGDDIAIFHRHNGANGKQWQSTCVECRRKQKRSRHG